MANQGGCEARWLARWLGSNTNENTGRLTRRRVVVEVDVSLSVGIELNSILYTTSELYGLSKHVILVLECVNVVIESN